MKSEVSILRCVAFVSISVVSLIVAYKLGKEQRCPPTWCTAPPPYKAIALEEGQTILAVVDEPKSMQFYIGNNVIGNGD